MPQDIYGCVKFRKNADVNLKLLLLSKLDKNAILLLEKVRLEKSLENLQQLAPHALVGGGWSRD